MAIQDVRFVSKDEAYRALAAVSTDGQGSIKQDDRGFWIDDFEVHPLVAAMPTQAEIDARPKSEPVVTPKSVPAGRKGNGTCAEIREWVAANPQATKADTLAQFSHLNPGTVQVQFGRARKS